MDEALGRALRGVYRRYYRPTAREHADRVELMRERYTQGLDLFTGKKLCGTELVDPTEERN